MCHCDATTLLRRYPALVIGSLRQAAFDGARKEYPLGYLRGHPLAGRILADPDGMLSVLALGGGSVLEAVTRGIGRVLGARADDGALRAVDGVLVGEIFVRLIASFLLLPRLALDPEDDEAVRALFRACVVEGLGQRAKRNA
jgi:hypothetical protein